MVIDVSIYVYILAMFISSGWNLHALTLLDSEASRWLSDI